ncbi:uncharacterized protein MEPE_01810 [Melanopsichium pennsylvanicum]|uniref:Uncharacterized protein n=2 Tax=Melanopsichium pennsylvanicum TaxID=63383 RepID=A0AAJ4XIP9_9BASI|nr:uncharacterized protein BN887_04103 [Melanopsichium pennsylvanicum 4]SNX83104.1 uncharacterized protein MEPE_01810 [Melanopsichium pennsylvanicum]
MVRKTVIIVVAISQALTTTSTASPEPTPARSPIGNQPASSIEPIPGVSADTPGQPLTSAPTSNIPLSSSPSIHTTTTSTQTGLATTSECTSPPQSESHDSDIAPLLESCANSLSPFLLPPSERGRGALRISELTDLAVRVNRALELSRLPPTAAPPTTDSNTTLRSLEAKCDAMGRAISAIQQALSPSPQSDRASTRQSAPNSYVAAAQAGLHRLAGPATATRQTRGLSHLHQVVAPILASKQRPRDLRITLKTRSLPDTHPARTASPANLLAKLDPAIKSAAGFRPLNVTRLASGDLAINFANMEQVASATITQSVWRTAAFGTDAPAPEIAQQQFAPTHCCVVHGVPTETNLQETCEDASDRNGAHIVNAKWLLGDKRCSQARHASAILQFVDVVAFITRRRKAQQNRSKILAKETTEFKNSQ